MQRLSSPKMSKAEDKWALTRETIGSDKLSIVMPLYRLAAEAEANLKSVADLFEHHRVETELVPVDDGSGDGTAEILEGFHVERYRHVTLKPVVCRRNGGKGAALRAGFAASSGRYVMLLDGDLDINPRQTPFFFEEMATKNADIVIGSKRHPKSVVQYPWHRRIVSACYFAFVRFFIGLPITDTQTGMKLFKREVLGPALDRMLVKTYAFDLELLAIAAGRGAKIAEAPVVIKFGNKFGALRPSTVNKMATDTLAVFYRLRVLRYYAKCLVPTALDHDPLVSVVIACPRRSWMLDECLEAMGQQTYRNFEVIVLPDDEVEEVERSSTINAGKSAKGEGESSSTINSGKSAKVEGESSSTINAGKSAKGEGESSSTINSGKSAKVEGESSSTIKSEKSAENQRPLSSGFRLSVIPTGKVRPAEKRNIGIREAKGEIVAFIDDDAYPDVHWLEYAVKYFGEREIGAVGGPGVTPPGDSFLARMGGRVYDSWLVSGNFRYRYRAGGVRKDVDDYPSCNLFVRKSLLDSIGGYRTDFWPGEDTLLCKDIVDNWKRIVYDPWVVVYHHRRPLFMPHLRQLGRYAFHRGYFCKRFPSNSLRLSYFVPSAFDLYLVAWVVLALLPQPEAMPAWLFLAWQGFLAVPMLAYFALVFAFSFSLNLVVWILTAAGVFATHVWYGLRFVQGLCAGKAPCEYIGKDHAHGQ